MAEKILIDGTYSSSTTIVATNSENKLKEVLMDSSLIKSIRSNIYLGTIIRVEHALQAAFVDFGGDRNGFLPFSDIHPDYYQLPSGDKDAINAEIKKHQDIANEENEKNEKEEDENIDEEKTSSSYDIYKRYNIQEVIKRGQNVLVQVYKDERGNKGASLTTYISLPGRYCVFMPNSLSGIGVSRKIVESSERRRIISAVKKFPLAPGMSIVVRTAGENIPEEDLYKDYEYLIKLWNKIRTTTLESKTMSMIYSETGIIKQAIRDMYSKKTESIIVQGSDVYEQVLEAINDLSPQDIDKVILYKETTPLFVKHNIDKQLKDLLYERVDLPSGGSIVIQATEALTSIDVNSGKSTAEKNIEDTALKINMEAAIEIARQLKLRDLGGLIVVDFIDMLDIRNRKMVERTLKSAFYNDRAKVQFARISIFGLLELSRQRIRSSINDLSTIPCVACGGCGKVRAVDVVVTNLLKDLSQFISQNKLYTKFDIQCSPQTTVALKNSRKDDLNKLENKYKVALNFIDIPQMILDQYKIIAKKDSSDLGQIVSDYKGTPLSLYYYEQQKNLFDKEKDMSTVDTGSHKSDGQKNRHPRANGYKGSKDKFDRSADPKDSAGRYPPRKKPYSKTGYQGKNNKYEIKPKKQGIVGRLFGALFGK